METVRNIRIVLVSIILLLLGASIYFIHSRTKQHSASVHIESVQTGLKRFHVVEQTPNRINWELWAESASLSSNETHSHLVNPRVLIYLEKSRTPVEITARQGELDQKTKEIILRDSVTAHSGKLTLQTEEVFWSNKSGILQTDKPVSITGENFTLSGIGMKAKLTSQQIRILKQIEGTLLLKKFPRIGLQSSPKTSE